MKVLIFGNETYGPDSLPLRLLPQLKDKLPDITFIPADPNEDWDIDESVTMIDTIINLDEPRVFESLDIFSTSPRVSMHDFDALAQLRLLQKLGKIKRVRILGLPPDATIEQSLDWLIAQLA